MNDKYSVTLLPEENIYLVKNPNNGPQLSFSASSGLQLLEIQDGPYLYAFKDLNRNGKLDPYEDWRLPVEERARDLASRLSVEEMAGLMLYPVQEPTDGEDKRSEQVDNRKIRFFLSNQSTRENSAPWNNMMQARVEKNGPHGIPLNLASDPRNTIAGGRFIVFGDDGMSEWPGNLGLAATFDPEYTLKHGQIASREYRAFGITTALSPQVDLATEPRWSRFGGTFGEGSKLAGDCAAAYVHGFQSTWNGIGKDAEDLGWGKDSVVTMIKHFPSDGAAEAGREAHNNFGKFNVYPGDNLKEHISVFEKAFHIADSKTGGAKSVMPSYSIAQSPHGSLGRPVASGYSKYKLTDILRNELGYDDLVCADWDITYDKKWGVEDMPFVMRHYLGITAGLDMIGGSNDAEANRDAFYLGTMLRKNYPMNLPGMPKEMMERANAGLDPTPPEEQMMAIYRKAAERCLKISFYAGLFEDPYIVMQDREQVLNTPLFRQEGYKAQLASLVLLKNKGNLIGKFDGKIKTVYVPLNYQPAMTFFFGGGVPASITMPFDSCQENPWIRFVTDEIRPEADPNNYLQSDIIRRTDFTGVDFAIVTADSPSGGNGFDPKAVNLDPTKGELDNGYRPVSLQYGPYYADPKFVREFPIGIDPDEETAWVKAGGQRGKSRYYGGKTVTAENEGSLRLMLETKQRIGNIPMMVYLTVTKPMCFYEFEEQADAILVGFSVSDQAALEVIGGNYEPKGLLPCQMPANMETVETQMEDVPFDMECHVDTQGNRYDYGYGLDWSGVISDWRTEKYGRN